MGVAASVRDRCHWGNGKYSTKPLIGGHFAMWPAVPEISTALRHFKELACEEQDEKLYNKIDQDGCVLYQEGNLVVCDLRVGIV